MILTEKDRIWFARLNALKSALKLQIDFMMLQIIAADRAAKLAPKKLRTKKRRRS
jgi:hypothetical protein